MAQSLLQKARLAVLGNMHKFLDTVVNTPEAYAQAIRDLESAMADVRAARDESIGTTSGYDRSITNAKGQQAQIQADIDLLLGDDDESNDEAALKLQIKLSNIDDTITDNQTLKESSEKDTRELSSAIEQLEGKHQQMTRDLGKLNLTAAATSAKNRASAAAEAALGASSAVGDVSIDSIQQRIEHENDVASARFDRVIGGMQQAQTPEGAAELARAKAALDARRAQIKAAATQ